MSNNQVVGSPIAPEDTANQNASSSVVYVALGKIKDAVEFAWDLTVMQVESAQYDPRISHTAFAQFLVHNVRHFVYQIDGVFPGIAVDLVPNLRRSAYHVQVRLHGILITISAVEDRFARPRHAVFRDYYASRQMAFDINSSTNYFEFRGPPDAPDTSPRYFQILHGPKPGDRHLLGFLVIAPVDQHNKLVCPPQDIDKFLASFFVPTEESQSQVESIVPNFSFQPTQ